MNQFAVDRRNGVLLVTFADPFTTERLSAFDDEVKAFIVREGEMPAIIDFTHVVSIGIGSSTAVSRGKSEPLMRRQPRVFVSPNDLLYGFLRVYAAHQDIRGLLPPVIVRSLATAFAELSLKEPSFEPVRIEPLEAQRAGGL